MAAGSETSIPAAQACAVSRQKPIRSRGRPRGRGRLGDAGQLRRRRAQPEPAAGRVLEDDHRPRPVPPSTSASASASPSARRSVPAATPAPRCDPMWTLTNRPAEPGRRPQVAGEDRHGATEEVLLDPGEVHEVRGMDRDRRDVVAPRGGPGTPAARPAAAARRRHAVGLSTKTWIALAPISWARSTALTMPLPSGRWAPRRRPSGSIRGIVRRAAVRPRPSAGSLRDARSRRAPARSGRGCVPACSRHRRRARSGRSRRRLAGTGSRPARSRR